MPLSALILALLAIPLSFVNPRASRSVNLVFALLTYMVYTNLLIVSAGVGVAGQARVRARLVGGARARCCCVLLVLFAQRMTLGAAAPAAAALSRAMSSRTLERYLAREIYGAVGFVLLAFLALFAFFDLIDELRDLGKGDYRLRQMFAFVLLSVAGARLRADADRGADRHALRALAPRRAIPSTP